MIGTRYENYSDSKTNLPFVLNCDLIRTPIKFSKEYNWHEDLEIQICLDGSGWVLINGEKYAFKKGSVVIVPPNAIHYTGSDKFINYSCIIVKSEFCKSVDIDFNKLIFPPVIDSVKLSQLIFKLQEIFKDDDYPCRVAELYGALIDILVELTVKHAIEQTKIVPVPSKSHEMVKSAIKFIRENYSQKLSLDDVARAALTNKFSLSREFMKLTGQTVVENINRFRVLKALDYLENGYTVSRTAIECGFDNFSYFTKTFKKYIGKKPSEISRLC